MEQYWMPKKLDFKNLRLCLDNYPVDFLYIRLVVSWKDVHLQRHLGQSL